jgi:hypothetical protein
LPRARRPDSVLGQRCALEARPRAAGPKRLSDTRGSPRRRHRAVVDDDPPDPGRWLRRAPFGKEIPSDPRFGSTRRNRRKNRLRPRRWVSPTAAAYRPR